MTRGRHREQAANGRRGYAKRRRARRQDHREERTASRAARQRRVFAGFFGGST